MNKSEFLELNLPSRDNTTDIADINAISDNFKTIDSTFFDLVERANQKFQTKENINLNFDDDSTNEEQYPSVPAVVNFTNRKVDPLKIINSASGNTIALKDSAKYKLKGLKLYGKTTQNGTPTPDAPVPLVSVGDSGSFVVGVYGKNIFDITTLTPRNSTQGGTVTFNGDVANISSSNQKWATCKSNTIKVIKGIPLILSYRVSNFSATTSTYIALQSKDGKEYGASYFVKDGWYIYKFTPTEDTLCILVVSNGSNSVITNTFTLSETQIEIGTDATPYEPCNKQTLTMPYELRSKDEIDFARGVRIEKAIAKVFSGDEFFQMLTNTTGGGYYFQYSNDQIKASVSNSSLTGAMCNRLIEKTSDVLWQRNEQGFSIASSSPQVRLRIDGCTTVAELQAKLKEWYDEGNPLTIITERTTPIETPLTEAELNAYRHLMTNKGDTTILSEADMEVSYVADTKLYIDNKIAELTALTLEV